MKDPPYRIKNMMPGMIMLWYGSVETIPSGWHLCDGTAGTIDLRNKFVPCAGDIYDPLDTGGADSQTHDFTGDGHDHVLSPGYGLQGGNDFWETTAERSAVGTTDAADNRPQYKALCYIQKL